MWVAGARHSRREQVSCCSWRQLRRSATTESRLIASSKRYRALGSRVYIILVYLQQLVINSGVPERAHRYNTRFHDRSARSRRLHVRSAHYSFTALAFYTNQLARLSRQLNVHSHHTTDVGQLAERYVFCIIGRAIAAITPASNVSLSHSALALVL